MTTTFKTVNVDSTGARYSPDAARSASPGSSSTRRDGARKAVPLSDIPLQTILDRGAAGIYKAKPVRIFGFEEIQEAHRLMDAYGADGKLVVTLEKTASRKVA